MMLTELFGLRRSERPPARTVRNLSPERTEFNLNDPLAWEVFLGGTQSASGVRVTQKSAMSIAAVWQVLNLLSGDVVKLPLYPYLRLPDDDREIATKHRAYITTSKKANRETSARKFWRTMMVHACMWNNAYAYITQSRGRYEMLNLLPDRTAPEWVTFKGENGKDRVELVYVTEAGGKLVTLMPHEVFHLTGISCDGVAGLDLIEYARDQFGLNLAAQQFQSKFFKNGARMGGILELPAGMPKPARDNVEEGFRKSYEGGDNPFKTVVLRDNAKFHAGQVTPDQSQMSELRDEDVREVARRWNIPPSKLGIRDSQSYNSFEQDNLSYLHGALHHWLDAIADEANMKLLTEREFLDDTHYFEHNVSKFIQADWKTMNESLEIQRRNEVINADEWRRKLNMNKRPDGKGGEYINPNTRSRNEPRTDDKPAKEPEPKNITQAGFGGDLVVNMGGIHMPPVQQQVVTTPPPLPMPPPKDDGEDGNISVVGMMLNMLHTQISDLSSDLTTMRTEVTALATIKATPPREPVNQLFVTLTSERQRLADQYGQETGDEILLAAQQLRGMPQAAEDSSDALVRLAGTSAMNTAATIGAIQEQGEAMRKLAEANAMSATAIVEGFQNQMAPIASAIDGTGDKLSAAADRLVQAVADKDMKPTITIEPTPVQVIQQQECDLIPVRDGKTGLVQKFQKRAAK